MHESFEIGASKPQADAGCGPDSGVWGWLGEDGGDGFSFSLDQSPLLSALLPVQRTEPCLDSRPPRLFPFRPSSFLSLPLSDEDSLVKTSGPFQNDPIALCLQDDRAGGRGRRRHLLCYEKWAQERSECESFLPWRPSSENESGRWLNKKRTVLRIAVDIWLLGLFSIQQHNQSNCPRLAFLPRSWKGQTSLPPT